MEYVLPGSAEFTLKAVNAAMYDNPGASSNWLPCVTILSDSGHVIARAVDTGVMVTAGGDAEVSWFPGVKHAGAGAGGSAPDYILLGGVSHAIPSTAGGDSGLVPWNETNYVTNDASLWTFTLDGSGHITHIKGLQPGRYEALATFHFDAPGASTSETFAVVCTGMVGGNTTSTAAITTTKVYEGMAGVFGQSTFGGSFFSCTYSLDTATTSAIRGQHWWIKRWAI